LVAGQYSLILIPTATGIAMVRKSPYVIISLLCLISFTTEVFADDRLNTPLSIRVGAYENKPKIFSDDSGRIVGLFPDTLALP